jgi:hypothetical protein
MYARKTRNGGAEPSARLTGPGMFRGLTDSTAGRQTANGGDPFHSFAASTMIARRLALYNTSTTAASAI